jgi:hypothetical protein
LIFFAVTTIGTYKIIMGAPGILEVVDQANIIKNWGKKVGPNI